MPQVTLGILFTDCLPWQCSPVNVHVVRTSLQVAEHENLLAASSSACGPCTEATLLQLDTMRDMGTPLLTPQPPDPAVMSRMQVRCGVNDTCPLEVAVTQVLCCAVLCSALLCCAESLHFVCDLSSAVSLLFFSSCALVDCYVFAVESMSGVHKR